jgi:malonyl-CoA decarboxylase
LLPAAEARKLTEVTKLGNDADALRFALNLPDWRSDSALSEALQAPLVRLCAHYLVNEKGRGDRARDPVAHFHLTNGARVERINWLADTSERGLRASAGLMVNYLYELDRIEENHERYTGEGRVTASSAVTRLLKS